jgi:hypothetical protein
LGFRGKVAVVSRGFKGIEKAIVVRRFMRSERR